MNESIAGKADEAGGKEGESRAIYNGEDQLIHSLAIRSVLGGTVEPLPSRSTTLFPRTPALAIRAATRGWEA